MKSIINKTDLRVGMKKRDVSYLVIFILLIVAAGLAYFYFRDGLDVRLSPTNVILTWTDNANNEDGFTVERDIVGTFTNPTVVPSCNVGSSAGVGLQVTCSEPLSGLALATTYYYRVRAYNINGPSGWSNSYSVETLWGQCDPGPPTAQTSSCSTPGNPLIGVCQVGTRTCQPNGAWGSCVGEVLPGVENTVATCTDGLDNDCDGLFDCSDSDCTGIASCACVPNTPTACYTGAQNVGVCAGATKICNAQGTGYGVCSVVPSAEICNGQDDDCDGFTDEDPNNSNNPLTQTCSTLGNPIGVGECRAGTQTCGSGAWGACAGETFASLEICTGGLDEDCDTYYDCNDINSCATSLYCTAPAAPDLFTAGLG